MLSLYLLDPVIRLFLLLLVYIGILAQLASVFFTWYLQKEKRRLWRIIFEFAIFLHFFVLGLSLSLIQVHSLSALLASPYVTLRYALMLVPLIGVPLLFEEKQNSDALAMIALIFTLPFMESFFGKEYYLALIFSTMLLLLRALAQVSALRQNARTDITRLSMKEAFDSFPEPLAIGAHNGRIDLMNSSMRTMNVEMNLPNDKMESFRNGLYEKAEKQEGTDGVYALSRGDTVYQLKEQSFKAPTKTYDLLMLRDISDEADLIEMLTQKNEELAESNQQLEAILEQIGTITTEREKTRLRNRIHDVMGQRLSILHLYMQQLDEDREKAPPLSEITQLLDSMFEDLKASANTEVPVTVDSIRDTAALVDVSFTLKGDLPKDPKLNRLFLNVLREAVTNAIRHAQAKKISAVAKEDDMAYRLTVKNDGRPAKFPLREGEGLKGMRFQVEEAGGTLTIEEKGPFELVVEVPKEESHTK